MISTPVLVLRKTPYSETSIIAATLSPEHGRLDFMIKGARQISRKKFPQVDLFRELEVHFHHNNSGLNNIHSVELISSFDNIASFPSNYLSGCEIATFVLRNSQSMIPSPEVYSALKTSFSALSSSKTDIPWTALLKLVYLDEHGFLPEDMDLSGDSKKQEVMENLLDAVILGSPLPDFPSKTWQKLAEWADKLCKYHELE
ncbi:MAG TPA: DNA repair protein RecO [Lentisphaeria bacterium]|nr:MAG: DNA repair protein RecO [Lentisphaerae bacterium GWF2_49_21]HBC88322.1 DNA repair protein RecO [Lentisphaeria bacterium]